MLVADLLAAIDDKQAPTTPEQRSVFGVALATFEATLGHTLPADYRDFLSQCNGGYVGGALWFKGPTPEGKPADAGVHHVGGFRAEWHFSLPEHRTCYDGRIPAELVWVMDDPFGNAICVGLSGTRRGAVFFWDHENEPQDGWDGTFETAGNIQLLANTFAEFVEGLGANE
jgi:hypothetical protein